jgi:muramoyltetrapeptide carboxypeptidase LdcA involved in peptidoglycan recycling
VYELGLARLCEHFELEPVEYPTTRRLGASAADRADDLVAAFSDDAIKAVFASLGGDDQVTYVKNLPTEAFRNHPKPFFGFSDNTHFANHLWHCRVPSFYGGHILGQFGMHGAMDQMTLDYLGTALFHRGERELHASKVFNDVGLDWKDPSLLGTRRAYEPNDGWYWDGTGVTSGISWGGCLESIDELLRHGQRLPSLNEFGGIVLVTETSEEIPRAGVVHRVYRALGERGILAQVKAVLVGRPKAWEFDQLRDTAARQAYRAEQRQITLQTIRHYNASAPVVQNVDFGHTDPQICLPYGGLIRLDSSARRLWAQF